MKPFDFDAPGKSDKYHENYKIFQNRSINAPIIFVSSYSRVCCTFLQSNWISDKPFCFSAVRLGPWKLSCPHFSVLPSNPSYLTYNYVQKRLGRPHDYNHHGKLSFPYKILYWILIIMIVFRNQSSTEKHKGYSIIPSICREPSQLFNSCAGS